MKLISQSFKLGILNLLSQKWKIWKIEEPNVTLRSMCLCVCVCVCGKIKAIKSTKHTRTIKTINHKTLHMFYYLLQTAKRYLFIYLFLFYVERKTFSFYFEFKITYFLDWFCRLLLSLVLLGCNFLLRLRTKGRKWDVTGKCLYFTPLPLDGTALKCKIGKQMKRQSKILS